MGSTRSAKSYIKAWRSHMQSMYMLAMTPSRELSDEVRRTLEKLEDLIVEVARDKGLK